MLGYDVPHRSEIDQRWGACGIVHEDAIGAKLEFEGPVPTICAVSEHVE